MVVSWSTRFTRVILESCSRFFGKRLQIGQQHGYKQFPVLQRFGKIGFGLLASTSLSLTVFKPVLAFTKPEQAIQSMQSVVERADALYDQVKYEEMYTLLLQYKDQNSDELLWRLARAIFEKSKLQESKEEKVQLLKQAKEYVYKSLSINEANFAAHKWASILVVELAEQEGTKAKILQSIVSKEHMLRAHALNPKDGTTLYLLGVWSFTFADLSWHQRKLAAVIFATPPSSSYEEALVYFKKAEEAEPNFYSMNLLMLGKCYLRLNNKEMARNYLIKTKDYPQKTDEDKQAHLEAVQLLKNLG